MECRVGCAACCIAPSISSSMPNGKAIDFAIIKNDDSDWSTGLFKKFPEIVDKKESMDFIKWGGDWRILKTIHILKLNKI